MKFIEFINSLSKQDRENYEKYSQIRGTQQYKIIFTVLQNTWDEVRYQDVNAFVIYDKALKDTLYVFLGTFEEYLKTYILSHYDFAEGCNHKKDKYRNFGEMPKNFVRREVECEEITELYKKMALNFGDLIQFLKENKDERFDIEKIENIKKLRDKVMHHLPLLFNYNFEFNGDELKLQIDNLKELLPNQYKQKFEESIKNKTSETSKNVLEKYYEFFI